MEQPPGGMVQCRVLKTPEDLRDALLDAYVNYLEYVVTDEDRDPTKPEMREIQKKRQAMYAECMKEGL